MNTSLKVQEAIFTLFFTVKGVTSGIPVGTDAEEGVFLSVTAPLLTFQNMLLWSF